MQYQWVPTYLLKVHELTILTLNYVQKTWKQIWFKLRKYWLLI